MTMSDLIARLVKDGWLAGDDGSVLTHGNHRIILHPDGEHVACAHADAVTTARIADGGHPVYVAQVASTYEEVLAWAADDGEGSERHLTGGEVNGSAFPLIPTGWGGIVRGGAPIKQGD